MNLSDQVAALEKDWAENPRWKHVKRPYTAEEVVKLRGSLQPECTLARKGAEKLWKYLFTEDYINCLGALTGGSISNFLPQEVLKSIASVTFFIIGIRLFINSFSIDKEEKEDKEKN